jgi:hypothetical protein
MGQGARIPCTPGDLRVIYFICRPDDHRIKIGTTVRLSERLKQLVAQCDADLDVIAVMDGSFSEETGLHRRFAHLRTVGEWFEPGDDLIGFIVAEGREWDGSDDIPKDDVSVKMDAGVVEDCRIAASFKRMSLAEYLSETMRGIAKRDIDEGYAQRKEGDPPPKKRRSK